MKVQKRFIWKDSSSAAIFDNGSWDLTLPSGRIMRGVEESSQLAEAAVQKAHDEYVLAQWELGSLAGCGKYLAPLA